MLHFSQSAKAYFPIDTTDSGTVILVNALQPWNTESSVNITDFGMTISVYELHL